jgi:hypothetical protein
VAGWAVEAPTRTTHACISLARGEFTSAIGGRLGPFMPGDTHRGLEHSSTVEQESAEPLLVPLWVLALKYDEKKPALRVLVNGQTGKTWAKVPWSWPRILITVGIVLGLIAAAVIALNVHERMAR